MREDLEDANLKARLVKAAKLSTSRELNDTVQIMSARARRNKEAREELEEEKEVNAREPASTGQRHRRPNRPRMAALSLASEQDEASEDDAGIRRLREAGAIILGKPNVPPNLMDWQTDNPVYGRTNNPWDPQRTPGGSSGGSAVAMAVGYAYLEAGSDIGGSVRNPAHFCGIAAHKPSFGIVTDTGHRLNDPEEPIDLLVCGPMARYAEDLALAMEVLAGPEPRDAPAWRLELPPPRHERLSDYRIAVIDEEPVCPISGAVKAAIAHTADVCEQAGASVERGVALPFDSRSAHRTYLTLLRGALAGAISKAQFDEELDLANRARDDSSYRTLIACAFVQRHRDWLITDAQRLSLRKAWSHFFSRYDALLCPIAPTPAWPHDSRDRYERTIDVDGTAVSNTHLTLPTNREV